MHGNQAMNGLRHAFGVIVVVFILGALSARAADLPEIVSIPVASAGVSMVAGVFLPAGDGPFPVMIYSHGRSGTEVERSHTRLPDLRGYVRYWMHKGFAVVAPIRPGYGATGGVDREASGVRYDMFGN